MSSERQNGTRLMGLGCLMALGALLVSLSEARGQEIIPVTLDRPVVVVNSTCKQSNNNCNQCSVTVVDDNGVKKCAGRICLDDIPINFKICVPSEEGNCTLTQAIQVTCGDSCYIVFCSTVQPGLPNDACTGCVCTIDIEYPDVAIIHICQ